MLFTLFFCVQPTRCLIFGLNCVGAQDTVTHFHFVKTFFFEIHTILSKQAISLKPFSPLGTLIRKRVRKKLAAQIQ
jgi:hypothetical protein